MTATEDGETPKCSTSGRGDAWDQDFGRISHPSFDEEQKACWVVFNCADDAAHALEIFSMLGVVPDPGRQMVLRERARRRRLLSNG